MKYQVSETKVTSPIYRAPEVFLKKKYSYEIDSWAVGIIFYKMLYLKLSQIRSKKTFMQSVYPYKSVESAKMQFVISRKKNSIRLKQMRVLFLTSG